MDLGDFDPRYIETDDEEIRIKIDLQNRVLTIYCYSNWRYGILEGYDSLEEAIDRMDADEDVEFKLKTCNREDADFIKIEYALGEICISTKYCKLKWFTYNDEWRELFEYLRDKMTAEYEIREEECSSSSSSESLYDEYAGHTDDLFDPCPRNSYSYDLFDSYSDDYESSFE